MRVKAPNSSASPFTAAAATAPVAPAAAAGDNNAQVGAGTSAAVGTAIPAATDATSSSAAAAEAAAAAAQREVQGQPSGEASDTITPFASRAATADASDADDGGRARAAPGGAGGTGEGAGAGSDHAAMEPRGSAADEAAALHHKIANLSARMQARCTKLLKLSLALRHWNVTIVGSSCAGCERTQNAWLQVVSGCSAVRSSDQDECSKRALLTAHAASRCTTAQVRLLSFPNLQAATYDAAVNHSVAESHIAGPLAAVPKWTRIPSRRVAWIVFLHELRLLREVAGNRAGNGWNDCCVPCSC